MMVLSADWTSEALEQLRVVWWKEEADLAKDFANVADREAGPRHVSGLEVFPCVNCAPATVILILYLVFVRMSGGLSSSKYHLSVFTAAWKARAVVLGVFEIRVDEEGEDASCIWGSREVFTMGFESKMGFLKSR